MEIKKSSKADLERKRIYFFLTGFLISGALLFFTLEWKYGEQTAEEALTPEDIQAMVTLDEEIEIIDQTYVVPEVLPPAPTVYVEIYDVVDNRIPIEMPEITPWEDVPDEILKEAITLDNTAQVSDEQIYTRVEEMPEFPGGHTAFVQYLAQQIKYPASTVRKKITGLVICSFIIDKEGKVTQAEIVRGLEPAMDLEALRVINSMPQWKPGKNKGKVVMVKYIVPITFRL